MFGCLGAKAGGDFADLVVGFAPQCVDVGMFGADRDGSLGGAAEIDRDVRLLDAALGGGGAGEAVEAALVIDGGAGFGPDALQD